MRDAPEGGLIDDASEFSILFGDAVGYNGIEDKPFRFRDLPVKLHTMIYGYLITPIMKDYSSYDGLRLSCREMGQKIEKEVFEMIESLINEASKQLDCSVLVWHDYYNFKQRG